MARCCGTTGTCVCKVQGGRRIQVTGTGTAQDPFVIESLGSINTQSNEQFSFTISGDGTLDNPWLLDLDYAPSAGISGLPDVEAPTPPNGYLLGWDDAAQAWIPMAPVTAAPGAVSTGNSLEGDGSTTAPLEVSDDNAYYITIRTSGLGLSDAGINRLVRRFPDAGTRAVADPPAELGTLSVLDTAPGRVEFFDGLDWFPIDNGIRLDIQPGALMELSGPYAGGTVIQRVQQVTATTDTFGDFILLSPTDLVDYAGVLSVKVQPVGEIGWAAAVRADDLNGQIMCRAFRLDDGSAYDGFTLSCVVEALMY